MKLRSLLAGLGPEHRGVIAATLGLERSAPATAIAAELEIPGRLPALIAGLSEGSRGLLASAIFRAPDGHPIRVASHARTSAELIELERHGLSFAFKDRYSRVYLFPADLAEAIRVAIAAPFAETLETLPAPTSPLEAPAQLAHDAAAISARLARTPARIKADGGLYSREWPKLVAELPELPSPAADVFAHLAHERLRLALEWLQDAGGLRARVDDRPGQSNRRELVPAGDLAAELSLGPTALGQGLTRWVDEAGPLHVAMATLRACLGGRTVAIAALGQALEELLQLADVNVYFNRPDEVKDFQYALAMAGILPLWLAGALGIGLDGNGLPAVVALAPASTPAAAEGPLAICQGNFELVLLRPPTSIERLRLLSCTEATEGQAHVYRITRKSVAAGERFAGRAEGGPEAGALLALRELAGELPQNVERSVADWARGVSAPLRIRSAIMLDACSDELADALAGALGELVCERIGSTHLALDGERLSEIAPKLRAAGHELEPGLDRVSGDWREEPDRHPAAARAWEPSDPARHEFEPSGEQISSLSEPEPEPEPVPVPPPTPSPEREGAARAGLDDVSFEEILIALEEQSELLIMYSGSSGATNRVITPLELKGDRLRAYCHLREAERTFMVDSIVVAGHV